MNFEFDPNRPIYLQIIEEVKKRAARGDYPSGFQLPSVREMARVMNVNPNTMSRAYMELEREGFIDTRRGQGSFVTQEERRIEEERRQLATAARDRFVAEIRELALGAGAVEELLRDIREAVK
jgi:GntR family transcriptional regulator